MLVFLEGMVKEVGLDPTDDQMKDAIWGVLKSGRVVPGYGHAVLRKTDPRYTCQREFALKHLPDDKLFKVGLALPISLSERREGLVFLNLFSGRKVGQNHGVFSSHTLVK